MVGTCLMPTIYFIDLILSIYFLKKRSQDFFKNWKFIPRRKAVFHSLIPCAERISDKNSVHGIPAPNYTNRVISLGIFEGHHLRNSISIKPWKTSDQKISCYCPLNTLGFSSDVTFYIKKTWKGTEYKRVGYQHFLKNYFEL